MVLVFLGPGLTLCIHIRSVAQNPWLMVDGVTPNPKLLSYHGKSVEARDTRLRPGIKATEIHPGKTK